jgi:CheY-like chemotaxis protein
MPGMNGAEVIRRARAMRPAPSVFLITEYTNDSMLVERLGDVPLLNKPLQLVEFTTMVAWLFGIGEPGDAERSGV